jgi:pyruvate dehydrogenase E1 component alpha subunit
VYSQDFLQDLYKTLYIIRVFETRCIKLYRKGLIVGYYHPYLGEEAIATGVCAALSESDYIASTHRGHGHCLARGPDLRQMVAELLGRQTGMCRGLGGSMHIADVSAGNLGANGVVGANMPVAVGAALGISIRGEEAVVADFTTDGATCNGVFGESLNLAGAWNLPLLVIVENNQCAVATTIEECTAETDLYKRGEGYGVESFQVDGNDVLKVYERTREAVEICNAGKGPVLIEAVTFRYGGHHVNDPGKYLPQEKLDYYLAHDPVDIGRKYLMEQGQATEADVQVINDQVEQTMEEACVPQENDIIAAVKRAVYA